MSGTDRRSELLGLYFAEIRFATRVNTAKRGTVSFANIARVTSFRQIHPTLLTRFQMCHSEAPCFLMESE